MTGDRPSPWSRVLNGALGLVLGTLLVGLVGTRITGYYADVRTAADIKDDFSTQVMELTTTEAEGLRILIRDLSPQSFVLRRCASSAPTDAGPDAVCAEAATQAILDEQQRSIDGRLAHNQGLLLQKRMERRLTSTVPAEYDALLEDLKALRQLNSSTTCNADRRPPAEKLQRRYSFSDGRFEALVGPPTQGEDCEDHGDAFRPAATAMARELILQSEVVAAPLDTASIKGLDDTPSELLRSLVTDLFVILLAALGLVLFLVSLAFEHRRGAAPLERTGGPPSGGT